MKTYSAKKADLDQPRAWFIVDAKGKTLGRLASQVAHVLKGKHKPTYGTHYDIGDFVIVINAEQVRLTGNKMNQKTYFRHSGYPGGEKITPVRLMLQRHPERVVTSAVKGMLPKNSLGRQMLRKLKVYAGGEHPHVAQQPQPLEIKN
ncbi:MAG TPA: 50S ribosomal protein L13 [Caldithrix abyssi]|uniref:Large ribosomal subunit protein uL13 n=1 Tax=Caldithrix abyssi TaxID=187145 RepID=A0A7V5RNV2_CALAY|nr:50S ribosomal protein L13 [Caldithrix abyssi]